MLNGRKRTAAKTKQSSTYTISEFFLYKKHSMISIYSDNSSHFRHFWNIIRLSEFLPIPTITDIEN